MTTEESALWAQLGALARAARKRLDLNLKQTANQSGCSLSRISRFETQGDHLSIDTLRGLFQTIRPGLERLGTTASFVRLCHHLGLIVSDVGLPLSVTVAEHSLGPATLGLSPDLLTWLEVGRRLGDALKHARAATAFGKAAEVAKTPGGKALALAHLALTWREVSDLPAAEAALSQGLELLGLSDLPPDRAAPLRTLEARLSDGPSLQAYALLARVQSSLRLCADDFEQANRALITLERAGSLLADPRVQADAEHLRGKLLLCRAVRWESALWPEVERRDLVVAALQRLACARQLRRSSGDWLRLAQDWRREAHAWQLLGDAESWAQADRQAQEYYSESPAVVGLSLDRGRWAAVRGDLRTAERALHLVVYLAWEVQSPALLAAALGSLGEVLAGSAAGSGESRRRALEHVVAAMAAWPFCRETQRFRALERLARRLLASGDEAGGDLVGLLNLTRPPFDVVTAMPQYSESQLEEALAHLRRLADPAAAS